jgi:hypothetical protein
VSLNLEEEKRPGIVVFFFFWQAEDEERRRRNDEVKVKIALERSVNESSPGATNSQVNKNFFCAMLEKKFCLVF